MGRSKTATPKVPSAAQVARAHRKQGKKQARKDRRREWLRSRAHQNRHHGVPLAIDTAALITGCVGHYADPKTALITGAVSAAVVGVPAALAGMSDRERGFTAGHGIGAAAWAVASSVFGPFNPLVGAAGALGAITAQFGWIESRKVRTTVNNSKADKKNAQIWDGSGGVLDRAGLSGSTMFGTEVVWSADGRRQIGMIYHIDLAGSGVRSDQAIRYGSAIEAEIPGRLRKGAVTMIGDEDDTNHVMARVMWRKPWTLETKLEHPIVKHFDEISELVNAAVEHKMSNGATGGGELELPEHVKYLLPNMSTIKNPFPAGELDDGSTHYKRFWRKGYGAMHGIKIGFTGSGKTVDINSEIMSLMPSRDALIWVLDLSIKRGKDYEGWGDCIDWMATDNETAAEMFRQAIDFADGRGKEYRKSSILSPSIAPSIVIFIDEFSALWKQMPELCASVLGRATKEFRSQNLVLRFASQRGSQDDFGYGFAGVREMLVHGELLKVKHASEAAFTLSDTDNLPGDPAKFVYGEGVEEDGLTGTQVHRKGYFVDMGDDEDEEDRGVIPAIAALYGPYRPVLDEKTMKYARKSYLNRQRVGTANPLLTPENVTEQRNPAPIENDDDLAAHIARINTNAEWLTAFMNGEFRVNTAGEFGDDTDQESDMLNAPSKSLADMAADMGMPTGDDHLVREQRAEAAQAQFQAADAQRGTKLAELDERMKHISAEHAGMSLEDAFGQVEVKSFPDDDPLKVFCLSMLGKASTKGVATGQIAKRFAEQAGQDKAPSNTTVVARLKDLHAAGKAKAAGQGRGLRWYRADQAPADAQ